ncbi:MAG: 4-(cytidine 5'-diphospho)-2-C-methyl-D-erythritol kinase [Krumholzibacteria bacterium]|nr:4-(cytidine 5'-diphospho)-2-C-methyl-D-erythritol kinase [Candidatus Krumholzibacteria bacterium]
MNETGFTKGSRPVGRTVALQAPAKVNLHLEVLRRRHDGYHDIETVLQAVALFDAVRATLHEAFPGGEPLIDLTVDGDVPVPADESNLCWRAARHFCRATGVSGRLSLHLDKRIPAGAGLGGGSADAAAVLAACDRLFGTGLDPADLEKLGSGLGSDVPFFVRGGTQLGRGRGTLLTPLPTVRTGQFLIIKPPFELITSDVYGRLRMGLTVNSPAANIQVIKPILARFPQPTWPGYNRLEEVVLPEQPALQRHVLRLRALAPVAMLTGSGSAVVGVFQDGRDLATIREEFEQAGLWVRIVKPHPAGVGFTEG